MLTIGNCVSQRLSGTPCTKRALRQVTIPSMRHLPFIGVDGNMVRTSSGKDHKQHAKKVKKEKKKTIHKPAFELKMILVLLCDLERIR